jgi:hypothetical protein
VQTVYSFSGLRRARFEVTASSLRLSETLDTYSFLIISAKAIPISSLVFKQSSSLPWHLLCFNVHLHDVVAVPPEGFPVARTSAGAKLACGYSRLSSPRGSFEEGLCLSPNLFGIRKRLVSVAHGPGLPSSGVADLLLRRITSMVPGHSLLPPSSHVPRQLSLCSGPVDSHLVLVGIDCQFLARLESRAFCLGASASTGRRLRFSVDIFWGPGGRLWLVDPTTSKTPLVAIFSLATLFAWAVLCHLNPVSQFHLYKDPS